MTDLRHAFTVDVEEWYHPLRFYRDTSAFATARMRAGLEAMLRLLEAHDVHATFFWVGEVARAYPDLVKRLAGEGHEIGCHGLRHDTMVYSQTPDEFEADTREALEVLEDLTGTPVRCYRAPCFSVTSASLWALDVLAGLGVTVDSSVFPVRNWRYGIPGFPRAPSRWKTTELWEAPLSIRSFGGLTVPTTGGAYFRIYPYALTSANVRAAEERGEPIVFYIHPWELDPRHPRVAFDWRAQVTHYFGLHRTEARLRRLLREHRFGTLNEVIAPYRERLDSAGAA